MMLTPLVALLLALATPPSVADRIDRLAGFTASLPADRRVHVVRRLQSLGPAALDPMLARLQADSPAMSALRRRSPAAHRAFLAALAEAVGTLESPRSIPVLRALLDGPPADARVPRAAADGLGRLCRVAPTASLLVAHAAPGRPNRLAALGGLGSCRVEPAVVALTARLSDPDPEVTRIAAQSLGRLGSSWAWLALGPAAALEGPALRTRARDAILSVSPRRARDAGGADAGGPPARRAGDRAATRRAGIVGPGEALAPGASAVTDAGAPMIRSGA